MFASKTKPAHALNMCRTPHVWQYNCDLPFMLTPKLNILNCFMHNSVQLRASFLLQFINYCGFIGKSLSSRQKWYETPVTIY